LSVTTTDVLVLGAGPAGSATALFLARMGYEVTLLDRATFPRDKPCGEYLTPGAVALLRDELGVLPTLLANGAVRLTQETVVAHNLQSFGGATDALACPRVVTDQVLRDAAEAAGVRVLEGFHVRRVIRAQNQIVGASGIDSAGNAHSFRARVTVGADGTHSLLARELGVVKPIPRLQRIALVTHYESDEGRESVSDTGVTMHLPQDRTDACCGVGAACGPQFTRNVNIVVPASEAAHMAGQRQDYFENKLRVSFPQVWEQVKDTAQMGPLRSVGCFGHHTTRASDHGAVLVGDAATFINPFTGEGVYFALRGAQLAAEAIHEALKCSDVSRQGLRGYDAARRQELLPRYHLCDAVQRLVHSPALLSWAGERLRRSEPLTETILRTIGDVARPADLFSLANLRLAFSIF
jgi:geranylgeranyl reductase family protein